LLSIHSVICTIKLKSPHSVVIFSCHKKSPGPDFLKYAVMRTFDRHNENFWDINYQAITTIISSSVIINSSWRSIIQIWLCAVSNPELQLEDCVKSVTADALYVIHLSTRKHWFTFATSAITEALRGDVSSAEIRGYRMPSIVENVRRWKEIEMAVLKS